MKVCNKCHQQKESSSFGLDTRNPDGLRRTCKECRYKLETPKIEERRSMPRENLV